MKQYLNWVKQKAFLLLLIVVLIIIAVVLLAARATAPSENTPLSTHSSHGTAWNDITPGSTNVSDLEKYIGKPIRSNGNLLEFPSKSDTQNHVIITDGSKVVFIKEIRTPQENIPLSKSMTPYGPNFTRLYGPESSSGNNLYVYLDKGIAFLGNEITNTVNETWYFAPTSIQEFLKTWGKTYQTSPEKVNEEGSF